MYHPADMIALCYTSGGTLVGTRNIATTELRSLCQKCARAFVLACVSILINFMFYFNFLYYFIFFVFFNFS